MTEIRFCTACGGTFQAWTMTFTADWKRICHACSRAGFRMDMKLAAKQAEADIAAEQSAAKVPVDIMARRRWARFMETKLAEAAAEADFTAEQSAKVPVNIIAHSRSIERGENRIADLVGQIEHNAWEAGYEAAIRVAEHEGATTLVEVLREALAVYWETQGVERED